MHAPPYPPIPPINANQPQPIPTAHIAAPAPFAPTPSLIPGPFILLLLLPSIPLLLFSLGARPPDTSHLPFSTSDIFATGAFVTVAGIVVLCLGVYPETGQAVLEWIKDGNANGWQGPDADAGSQWPWAWKWDWLDGKTLRAAGADHPAGLAVNSVSNSVINGVGRQGSSSGCGLVRSAGLLSDVAGHAKTEWRFDPSIKRWVRVAVRPAAIQPQIQSRAILNSAYDAETQPSSSSSKRLSSGSGSDPSPSKSKLPSWVERELRKRKTEKPEESIRRLNAEEKKEVESTKKKGIKELDIFVMKRESDKAVLVKELKKRKMPLAGLKDTSKGKDQEGKGEDKGKDQDKKKDGKKGDDGEQGDQDADGGKEKDGGSSSKSKKIRKFLLGEKAGEGGEKSSTTQGPGWEIADPTLAQATLAKSGADAQMAAERLKGGG
ncbi:hypothetical protein I316_03321 [Kwoniella heveanensis BCC8398]|uniref:Uncharacterized protein n=1 Tax=Kwoniella heveanensis BCC8398 TaxID=1296120 RepID=A0A1B9GUR7_9TREE|nr:hypothetical protein I316_03321 [Kwoniella heveanensis BCC8398]